MNGVFPDLAELHVTAHLPGTFASLREDKDKLLSSLHV
jgi:hypothetical protein